MQNRVPTRDVKLNFDRSTTWQSGCSGLPVVSAAGTLANVVCTDVSQDVTRPPVFTRLLEGWMAQTLSQSSMDLSAAESSLGAASWSPLASVTGSLSATCFLQYSSTLLSVRLCTFGSGTTALEPVSSFCSSRRRGVRL